LASRLISKSPKSAVACMLAAASILTTRCFLSGMLLSTSKTMSVR
jgi:hypothetical protein